MSVLHVNEENFKQVLAENKLVVVDFYASWCGPCQMLAPVLEEIANENKSIVIAKIDADESMELCREFKVYSIPHVIIFKDGMQKESFVGYMPKEKIMNIITKYL